MRLEPTVRAVHASPAEGVVGGVETGPHGGPPVGCRRGQVIGVATFPEGTSGRVEKVRLVSDVRRATRRVTTV